MSATTEAQTTPRLLRDQCHLFFDPNEPPQIRVPPGTRLVVETEDAHMGSIRTEQDVYPTLASVFERLGGANPVTGPIYVEGVKPGDCVTVTIEDTGAERFDEYVCVTRQVMQDRAPRV